MKTIKLVAFVGLLSLAPIGYANVVVTGVSLAPDTIGVNDSTTITVNGYVNTVAPGQANCTGVEIFFGDSIYPSTDPNKPPGTYVRFQPASTASFPISVNHSYTQIGNYDVIVSAVQLYNGKWYQCGSTGNFATLTVLGDTIQSVRSITPAVVNQQTSVIVKGLGSCSQNVQVNWGDNNSSTIPGPVDLKLGGVASHTYTAAGTYTVTASGSVCDGVVTTALAVALTSRPGPVFDPAVIQNLRDRLDRFVQLPPLPPIPGGGPGCPVCEGLAQQIKMLDQTGRELQVQSNVVLKDFSANREKPRGLAKGSFASELVKQFDEYFGLRAQLMKLHGQALSQPRGTKAMPKK